MCIRDSPGPPASPGGGDAHHVGVGLQDDPWGPFTARSGGQQTTEIVACLLYTSCDATEEYSATIYTDAISTDLATIEEKTGNPIVELSDADIDTFWAACFEAKAADAMKRAEAHGVTEGMTTILQKAAEVTGYDWQG